MPGFHTPCCLALASSAGALHMMPFRNAPLASLTLPTYIVSRPFRFKSFVPTSRALTMYSIEKVTNISPNFLPCLSVVHPLVMDVTCLDSSDPLSCCAESEKMRCNQSLG